MNKIFLMGDIHGDSQPVRQFIQDYKDIENFDGSDTIIFLGDLGSLFYLDDNRDYQFKRNLSNYPFTYYNVRGNHEQRPSILAEQEPDQWVVTTEFGNTVYYEKHFPKIRYFRDDGGTYNINGKKVLILPGAYSIDKKTRQQYNYGWFPQEQMSEDEKAHILINLDEKYDYIFSHTCPISFEFFVRDLFTNHNQSTVDKSMERFLDTVIQQTKYEHYYFGHFHRNRDIKPYKATILFHQPLELGKYYSDL